MASPPSGASHVALVVGSTGLVGGHVVRTLAARGEHARIVVLVRRSSNDPVPPRVEVRIVDFDALDELEGRAFEGVSDVFACLGTTIAKAGSREAFRKVDHGYTLEAATLAKAAGATRLALVSSVGADPDASSFYLRTKGETERDVAALGFETLVIARPSLLVGERFESRPGEKAGIAAGRALSFAMIGGLRKYRPIGAERVAAALARAVSDGLPGKTVLHHGELDRA